MSIYFYYLTIVGNIFAVSSSLFVGKAGPLVHTGAIVSSLLAQYAGLFIPIILTGASYGRLVGISTVAMCVVLLELTDNLLLLPMMMLRTSRKCDLIEDLQFSEEEMEMFLDLHPFTNFSPYTVVETMSLAKALVLFREVGMRHLLVIPKINSYVCVAKFILVIYAACCLITELASCWYIDEAQFHGRTCVSFTSFTFESQTEKIKNPTAPSVLSLLIISARQLPELVFRSMFLYHDFSCL
ncbi:hypothetical protein ACFE04_003313 [Oxalis oulophora]